MNFITIQINSGTSCLITTNNILLDTSSKGEQLIVKCLPEGLLMAEFLEQIISCSRITLTGVGTSSTGSSTRRTNISGNPFTITLNDDDTYTQYTNCTIQSIIDDVITINFSNTNSRSEFSLDEITKELARSMEVYHKIKM